MVVVVVDEEAVHWRDDFGEAWKGGFSEHVRIESRLVDGTGEAWSSNPSRLGVGGLVSQRRLRQGRRLHVPGQTLVRDAPSRPNCIDWDVIHNISRLSFSTNHLPLHWWLLLRLTHVVGRFFPPIPFASSCCTMLRPSPLVVYLGI